jgi:hypothetical protein
MGDGCVARAVYDRRMRSVEISVPGGVCFVKIQGLETDDQGQ